MKQAWPKIHFEYREHDASHSRVWRSDWFRDQFEILSIEEFATFEKWAARFSFIVRKAEDDD